MKSVYKIGGMPYCDELLAQSQQLAWFSDKPLAVS